MRENLVRGSAVGGEAVLAAQPVVVDAGYVRHADEDEPLFVLADPAGHPFRILVSAG